MYWGSDINFTHTNNLSWHNKNKNRETECCPTLSVAALKLNVCSIVFLQSLGKVSEPHFLKKKL